jgi:hypothetical protein
MLPHRRTGATTLGSREVCEQVAPTCHAFNLRQPDWSSRAARIQLVVGIKVHVGSNEDLASLERCLCSLRAHYGADAFVFAAGYTAAEHKDRLQAIILRYQQATLLSCNRALPSVEALGLSAKFGSDHNASQFAFMHQQMYLMQPFPPLRSLQCPFMSFSVRLSRRKESTEMLMHELLSTRHGGVALPIHGSVLGNFSLNEDPESIPQLAFVCNRYALHRLRASPLFSPAQACSIRDDQQAERFLGAFARHQLSSPPIRCALDGCAPLPTRWVTHTDEAVCYAARATSHVPASPELDTTFAWPSRLPSQCAGSSTTTPLQRFVAPPEGIAQQLFAGLIAGSTSDAVFGTAAVQLLDAEPAHLRRTLIVVHSHAHTPFDYTHIRMLNLPRTRDIWIVRDAAILMLNNNRKQSTADLLSRLGRYAQRSRWLLHSPSNPGARHQHSPGYMCGEFASLADAAPIWSRYGWILYSNPDVVVTPELFARLAERLESDHLHRRPRNRRWRPPDIFMDQFPGGIKNKYRFAMEFLAFRSTTMLLSVGASEGANASNAFVRALQMCLTVKGVFPEELLTRIALLCHLRVAPLGAIKYLKFSRGFEIQARHNRSRHLFNSTSAGAKTFLYPGSIWHNHDHKQVQQYLSSEESNITGAATPTIPNAEQLKWFPFTDQHHEGEV